MQRQNLGTSFFMPTSINRFTLTIIIHLLIATGAAAQQVTLTLDSCRTLALKSNREIKISEQEIIKAIHTHKAALTAYLPKISASGTLLHNQKKTSLISRDKQIEIKDIGNTIKENVSNGLHDIASAMPQLSPIISAIENIDFSSHLNNLSNSITDALTIDTRNIYAVALTLTQPIFAGGEIAAYDRITRQLQDIAEYNCRTAEQKTILAVEEAYWQIVSLANKEKLARSFVALVEKLYNDVGMMKEAGLATNSELLSVNVRLNEAQMALLQAADGVKLARMLLCHICGLPLDSDIRVHEEDADEIPLPKTLPSSTNNDSPDARPELHSLQTAVGIREQQVNITRASYLPHLAFTANYIIGSPAVTDGFSKKATGMWNIGLLLKVPMWNWGEGIQKTKSAKAEAAIARYTLDNARENMRLQIHQAQQNISISEKQLQQARSSIKMADENLHSANIAFAEGMATEEELMEAQTAWLKAHSALIDAQISIILSHSRLRRALGTLK